MNEATDEMLGEIRAVLSDRLGVDTSKVDEGTLFKELGADSLHMIELVTELEDRFKVQIPDKEALLFTNVGDVIRFIRARAPE